MTSTRVPPTQATPAPSNASRTALAVSTLGFFVITLDTLIVNVALATIGDQLGGGTAGQQWIVDGYTLMFASLLLFAGNLSDRIGAKRAFTFGVVLFVLASAACAFAPALWILILLRFVQGAAASLMLPPSMDLIREAFPDAVQRSKAIGLWALGGAVAAAAGPALGGLLTTIDWRLVFLINVPVGAVAVALLMKVPVSPVRPATFDWLGQIAALAGVGALIFGLIEGGVLGFGAAQVLASLAVAVLALAVFLLAQARGRSPMMPLDLFQSPGLRIALSVGFSFMVGWYGMVFCHQPFPPATFGAVSSGGRFGGDAFGRSRRLPGDGQSFADSHRRGRLRCLVGRSSGIRARPAGQPADRGTTALVDGGCERFHPPDPELTHSSRETSWHPPRPHAGPSTRSGYSTTPFRPARRCRSITVRTSSKKAGTGR